jgi:hypothetical protein
MVRRRFFSAVSNHECPEPSFETRAKGPLHRMRTVFLSNYARTAARPGRAAKPALVA